MSDMDTVEFGTMTQNQRIKQWIAFAIYVGDLQIEAKMKRIKQLAEVHGANLPTNAQVENDQLWEQIALVKLHNELLKLIAQDVH